MFCDLLCGRFLWSVIKEVNIDTEFQANRHIEIDIGYSHEDGHAMNFKCIYMEN